MLDAIVEGLMARSELKAWSVRHMKSRSAQQYDLQAVTEAVRSVERERIIVNVLRETSNAEGEQRVGAGNVTLLPGEDISKALDEAAFMASLVHNEPYNFPEPTPLPEISIADNQMQGNPDESVRVILSRLKAGAAKNPSVRLTAAECTTSETITRIVNSRGIDAQQASTKLHLEWVLIAGKDEAEVESFVRLDRRRISDLNIEAVLARRMQRAADLLIAKKPPNYSGPVIVGGEALAEMMNSSVLQILSSAQFKYSGETPWEIGQSIFRAEVQGDAFTMWANRQLPYGTNSNRFDGEGIRAQRVELVRENELRAFTASQRFANYLDLPVTGAFGNIEIAPGSTSAEELAKLPHIEVAEFSWFNPDSLSGEFACEIRLGTIVDGEKRTTFKGGMLVGNLLDALANVHWSSETGFYGNYLGPVTARFNDLTVAGETSG